MRIFHGNKVKSIRNLIDISKGEIEYFVVVVSHLQWKLTWSFFGVHKMFLHVAVLSSYSHPICMFPTSIGVSHCTYHTHAFLCTPYEKWPAIYYRWFGVCFKLHRFFFGAIDSVSPLHLGFNFAVVAIFLH